MKEICKDGSFVIECIYVCMYRHRGSKYIDSSNYKPQSVLVMIHTLLGECTCHPELNLCTEALLLEV